MCCSLHEATASADPRYAACKQEICGNVTIPYPFWTNNSFCGHKSFRIHCVNGEPLFDLKFGSYRVEGIQTTFANVSFELKAMPGFNSSCLPDFHYSHHAQSGTLGLQPSYHNFQVRFAFRCNNLSNLFYYALPLKCFPNDTIQPYIALAPWPDLQQLTPCKSRFFMNAVVEKTDFNQTAKTILYKRFLEGSFRLHATISQKCQTCQSIRGACGQSEDEEVVCYCADSPISAICAKTAKDINTSGTSHPEIALGAGLEALIIVVIVLAILMICGSRTCPLLKFISHNNSAENSTMSDLIGSHVHFEVPIFHIKELEKATKNFNSSQVLGQGGFGTVYYGKLRDGREVAVKRLYQHNSRLLKQFIAEVQILAGLQHKNLVSLYGCTSRQSHELLLVYEYVPNGTLEDHLRGDRSNVGPLPWHIRMNIAVEIAQALAYLHASGIIHRDVKTNNILLDNSFGVKVGDFGLSRLFPDDVTHVSTAPQGTPGYVDPEYHLCYQLTEKSDVYSFGVVLMELASSLPAVDVSRDRHDINLANLAINRIQKRAFHELVDPSLGYDSDPRIKEMISGVIELAFMCLQHERDMRPSMVNVVEELQTIASATGDVANKCFSPSAASPGSDQAALLSMRDFSSLTPRTQKWFSSNESFGASNMSE
ncbi:hypothetical protein SAY87_025114 [Trapa incisa]|uniref:non-specific serine/threonine protein kinase n=1 Tax=Trapa incisa TaxID=236973 RepID=A0AAN7GE03_9MYRT|nr:hypothetical protein SAY87_025114 [Trapa incisa]